MRRGRDGSAAIIIIALLLLVSSGTTPAEHRIRDDASDCRVHPQSIPRRVVALAPSITEIVFALHCEDRLAGVTVFSDFPPGARGLPKVGSYKRPDLERIVALNPDLCIGIKDGNPTGVLQRLESLHIPVSTVDPRNLNALIQSILKIGCLLGADDRALSLSHRIQQRIDRVRQRVSRIRYRPRVFFQIGMDPIVSAGSATFINELIDLAGGRNLARGPVLYPRYNREQVIALFPDVLIITSMARQGGFEKERAAWQKWPRLPAVRFGRVHLVDSDVFDRPSPRLLDGLDLLARLLHPDIGAHHP